MSIEPRERFEGWVSTFVWTTGAGAGAHEDHDVVLA